MTSHSSHKAEFTALKPEHEAIPEKKGELILTPFSFFTLPWQIMSHMMAVPMHAVSATSRKKNAALESETYPITIKKQTKDAYLYIIKLPHIEREQVALHIKNHMILLDIKAAPTAPEKLHGGYHLYTVHRAMALPVFTDGEKIKAVLKEEVLTITIPKADKQAAPKSSSIDIE